MRARGRWDDGLAMLGRAIYSELEWCQLSVLRRGRHCSPLLCWAVRRGAGGSFVCPGALTSSRRKRGGKGRQGDGTVASTPGGDCGVRRVAVCVEASCGGVAGVVGRLEESGGGGDGRGAAGEWLGGPWRRRRHLARSVHGEASGDQGQGHADTGIRPYLANH